MRITPKAMARLGVTIPYAALGALCGSDDMCAHYEEIQ